VSDLAGRHPATQQIARFFAYDHLPEPMQTISAYSHHLAEAMIRELPDGPELTTGLRKLLEAKDCFVRAALPAGEQPETPDLEAELRQLRPEAVQLGINVEGRWSPARLQREIDRVKVANAEAEADG
jgi:hypothetical protein